MNHPFNHPFSDNVTLTLDNGYTIPLSPTKARSGNVYWCLREPDAKSAPFGIQRNKAVVGGKLPKSVSIFGKTHQLTVDNVKNSRHTTVGGLSINGENFSLRLSVRDLGDDVYNVTAHLNRAGKPKKEKAEKKLVAASKTTW